jgi:signal peptide peptidase SppA
MGLKLNFDKSNNSNYGPNVAVIRLHGAIGTGRGSLTLDRMRSTIKAAFNNEAADAVALDINSPGGSPVQSDLIGREIRYWADKKDMPVYSFVQDVAASGGYWLACAADEIYGMNSSITGSIGVISAGFGFDELIKKVGVERRIYTAGESKSKNDPFMPVNEDDLKKGKALREAIHDDFKDWVKTRRGEKLQANEDVLMNGDYWTSKKSKELGIIDGVGELQQVMRDKLGENTTFHYHSPRGPSLLKRLFSRAMDNEPANIGTAAIDRTVQQVREQQLWSRYGL